MINGFENVCKAMKVAKSMEEITEEVLAVLMKNGGQMRAKEVSFILSRDVDYHTVSKSLHWLVELGLVKRVVVEGEPVKIETEEVVYDDDVNAPYEIEVDGVLYHRVFPHPYTKWHFEKCVKTVIPKIPMFQYVGMFAN